MAQPDEQPRRRKSYFKLVLRVSVILGITIVATVVIAGWNTLYSKYLETEGPEIEVLELPRGIGIAPVSLKFQLRDRHSGLDEIVIRTRQKKTRKEVLRQSLEGKSSAMVNLDFPGQASSLQEGEVELNVKVFDRSFWSNSSEKLFPLRVDFRKPKVEVVTAQHNARQGGSQLLFYHASDDDLAVSGVKVGGQTFVGYPARGIDKDFQDSALYAAVYAVPLEGTTDPADLKVFAEDQVGNSVSTGFYNRIQPRTRRSVTQKLSDDFLLSVVDPLAENRAAVIDEIDNPGKGRDAFDLTLSGVNEEARLPLLRFKAVNERVRQADAIALSDILKGPVRFERYWERGFLMPPGGAQANFGDILVYLYEGREVGRADQDGYEFGLSTAYREVPAANDGIVSFSENLGVYGRTLGIDHGFGLTSIYGHLDQILVRKGERVVRGQKIALAGSTGFTRKPNLYFEVRVQGVPVDPVEWWEEGWFYAHITAKINDVKKALGIPVYTPLE